MIIFSVILNSPLKAGEVTELVSPSFKKMTVSISGHTPTDEKKANVKSIEKEKSKPRETPSYQEFTRPDENRECAEWWQGYLY